MTTLVEIAQGRANGFHDAPVRACNLDFVARTWGHQMRATASMSPGRSWSIFASPPSSSDARSGSEPVLFE